MDRERPLPRREQVFVISLMYHGFRLVYRRNRLKKRKGYIIPATLHEDAGGVDFFVKMPGAEHLLPVQITQRGVKHFKEFHHQEGPHLETFTKSAVQRLRNKRRRCARQGIAFVLVRDWRHPLPSRAIAWGDVKALRLAVGILENRRQQ